MMFFYLIALCMCFFFFFKQKTAYEMRISDWSSDVCSSDLVDDDVDGSLGAASGLPEELEHAVARRVSATSRSSGDRRFIRAASGSGPSSPHHDRCRALPSATPAVHRTCRRQLHRAA